MPVDPINRHSRTVTSAILALALGLTAAPVSAQQDSVDLEAVQQRVGRSLADSVTFTPQLEGRWTQSLPEVGELQASFDRLKSQANIPHAYLENGCDARAESSCSFLEGEVGHCIKVIVELDEPLISLSSANELMASRWKRHTAAGVLARDETGEVVARVLDPSANNAPVRVNEWVETIWDGQMPITVQMVPSVDPDSSPGFAQRQAARDNAFYSEALARVEARCRQDTAACPLPETEVEEMEKALVKQRYELGDYTPLALRLRYLGKI